MKDLCHLAGKYRGAAQSACNISLRIRREQDPILVVFHNLKGYDVHLLFLSMLEVKKITCIPNNMQNYTSFSLRGLRFIDSLHFLQASLDSLVKTCPSGVSELHLTACKKQKAALPASGQRGVSI